MVSNIFICSSQIIVEMILIDLRIFFKIGLKLKPPTSHSSHLPLGHLYIKWVVTWSLLNTSFDWRSFGLGDEILGKLYGGVIRSHLKDYDYVISQPKQFCLNVSKKIFWNYSTTLKAYECIPKTSYVVLVTVTLGLKEFGSLVVYLYTFKNWD